MASELRAREGRTLLKRLALSRRPGVFGWMSEEKRVSKIELQTYGTGDKHKTAWMC